MRVLYHLGKKNVVADALSWLSMVSVAHVEDEKKEVVRDVYRLSRFGVLLVYSSESGVLFHNGLESSLVSNVKVNQVLDPLLVDLKRSISKKAMEAFFQRVDEILWYQGQLYVVNVDDLRNKILLEDHSSRCPIQSGTT